MSIKFIPFCWQIPDLWLRPLASHRCFHRRSTSHVCVCVFFFFLCVCVPQCLCMLQRSSSDLGVDALLQQYLGHLQRTVNINYITREEDSCQSHHSASTLGIFVVYIYIYKKYLFRCLQPPSLQPLSRAAPVLLAASA